MAGEITLNASITYSDSEGTVSSLVVSGKSVNITTKLLAREKQAIATADTAIKLGSIATLGFLMLVNLDPTNFVEIKVAAAGTIIAKLFPGECCLFRVGSGITAPVAKADTAACQLDILVLSA